MAHYLIVNATITDPEMFAQYISAVGSTLGGHNLRVLVSTFDAETVEGESRGPRAVVIEGDDRDALLAWYRSPAYQEVIGLRLNSSDGFAILAAGL